VEPNKGLSDDLFNPEKVEVKGPAMPNIEEIMKKMTPMEEEEQQEE